MRDLITFNCDACKRKNYTTSKNKKTDDRQAVTEEILPGLSEPHAAQGRQGLNPLVYNATASDRRNGGQ